MTKLVWDVAAERLFETGIDQGILFVTDDTPYDVPIVWNGLTTVTESPGGAEATPQYADNIQYLTLVSAETFGGTIEAFTYPDEFGACDGTSLIQPGVSVHQQERKSFGLAYRTKLGSAEDSDFGYKWHLVYGALASPAEKAYATINDSPDAVSFSWDFTTTPVPFAEGKPTSLITINSTEVNGLDLAAFEAILMGTDGAPGTTGHLPLPDDLAELFSTPV